MGLDLRNGEGEGKVCVCVVEGKQEFLISQRCELLVI